MVHNTRPPITWGAPNPAYAMLQDTLFQVGDFNSHSSGFGLVELSSLKRGTQWLRPGQDTKGKLVPATSLRKVRSEDDLSLAMLPAEMEASEERNGPLAVCGPAEAEKHDNCKQLVLVEPPKVGVGIAAFKPSKRRNGGDKEDVKSTLDDLKAKLNARKGAAEVCTS